MKHSKFSPSQSPRWVNCTASFYVNEEMEIQGSESIYSREGTIAHDIASKVLKKEARLKSFLGYTEKFGDDEIYFDQDKLDYIQDYLDIVISYAREGELQVEEKVKVDEDIWGTSDARILTQETLHVFDLKFGKGETVHIEENEQMINYAAGALNEVDPIENDIKEAVLHIIQPRRTDGENIHQFWTVPIKELQPHVNRILKAKSQIKKGPEHTEFNPGHKQCRWCNYKGQCKHFAEYNLGIAGLTFAKYVEDKPQAIGEALGLVDDRFKEITDEQLLGMIRDKKLKVLELWIKSMREEALRRGIERRKKGEDLFGLKIVGSTKHRKFEDTAKVEKYVELILKKKPEEFSKEDFYTEPKLRSPAQFEKGPLKKLPEKARKKIEALIIKPKGDPQLVPENDNRAELPIDAETVFAKYSEDYAE